ncbi:MAG: hypothetical protein ACE5EM_02955 [Sphingomonadales bacterium]
MATEDQKPEETNEDDPMLPWSVSSGSEWERPGVVGWLNLVGVLQVGAGLLWMIAGLVVYGGFIAFVTGISISLTAVFTFGFAKLIELVARLESRKSS